MLPAGPDDDTVSSVVFGREFQSLIVPMTILVPLYQRNVCFTVRLDCIKCEGERAQGVSDMHTSYALTNLRHSAGMVAPAE